MESVYLGFDSSTQGLTAVALAGGDFSPLGVWSLNFEQDLSEYGTKRGVLENPTDPHVVHGPPRMWADALDRLFGRMRREGFDFTAVTAIAGSAQQHGSVYLNAHFPAQLERLDPRRPLVEQLKGVFSRPTSPIWMDSSTADECAEITAALGGARALAEITGSAAFERFTGPQIRRFYKTELAAYEKTAHIRLISSYLASLLAGRVAPTDWGDGSGMNLLDLHVRACHPGALAATAPDLARRLGAPAPSVTVVGPPAAYWVERYGLAPRAQIVVWTGDNPSSLIGVGLVEGGQWAISLGTSDTCFGCLTQPRADPRAEGHVFGSPTGEFMSLLCFRNGSLARERIRDAYGLDWAGFSAALRATPPGNGGRLMLPWFEPEIVPKAPGGGPRRIGLAPADAAANCRAVVEGQLLSMRLHSAWMGEPPRRIYATGGASRNRDLLRVMADVFQTPVYPFEQSNSAALGAAARAAFVARQQRGAPVSWRELAAAIARPDEAGRLAPDPATAAVYDALLQKYADAETAALRAD